MPCGKAKTVPCCKIPTLVVWLNSSHRHHHQQLRFASAGKDSAWSLQARAVRASDYRETLCRSVRQTVPCESPDRKRDVRQSVPTCSSNASTVSGPSYSAIAGAFGRRVAVACSICAAAGVGEQEKQSQDSGGVGDVQSKVRSRASPRTSRNPHGPPTPPSASSSDSQGT